MKTLWMAGVVVGVACGAAFADTQKGSSTLAVFGGLGFSSTELDLGVTGGREDVAEGGGVIGGQWVYFFRDHPVVGVGLDGAYTSLADRRTLDLVRAADTTSHLRSTTILAIAKLAYPTGRARPYVFGGLGVHHSTVFASAKPYGPFTWQDTSTNESRTLLDDTNTSLAIGYGLGMDFFLSETFFLGTEYRGVFLAHKEFDETAGARSAGLDFTNRGMNVQGFLLRLGIKFGP